MATIGEVGAFVPDRESLSEQENPPRYLYFGVFFDGTSNNMIQKEIAVAHRKRSEEAKRSPDDLVLSNPGTFENGANVLQIGKNQAHLPKYSNIAILHSAYSGLMPEQYPDGEVRIYNIYVEGPGTDSEDDGSMLTKVYNWKGSVFGKGHSGVSKLVRKAVDMVRLRMKGYSSLELRNTEIHFDIFGFSRGAACARLFAYLALRKTDERLPCEDDLGAKEGEILHFLDDAEYKDVSVDFLGIYDTVVSIGGIKTESYLDNVNEYAQYSPHLPKVKSTFHLCAMDEFRAHFGLTDIGDAVNKTKHAEVFIPGCHSDVGGGYVDTDDCSFTMDARTKIQKEDYLMPLDRIEKASSATTPILQGLHELGWAEEERLEVDGTKVKVPRDPVKCGYSNIPLRMMHDRGNTQTENKRRMFNAIPPAYSIPDVLGIWKEDLMKYVEKDGRHFYYPGGSFSSESYRRLRRYLHFSAKNSIGFYPSFNGRLICRYIYHGNKGQAQEWFTTDYQEDAFSPSAGRNGELLHVAKVKTDSASIFLHSIKGSCIG